MRPEHKEVIQQVIDRLLYNGDDYKEALEKLNAKFDPHKKTTFCSDPSKFKFALDKAI